MSGGGRNKKPRPGSSCLDGARNAETIGAMWYAKQNNFESPNSSAVLASRGSQALHNALHVPITLNPLLLQERIKINEYRLLATG